MSADTSVGGAKWPNFALPHGTTVNGYRIERVLGSGGFGVTYLARDLLQQPFAIKEYYPRQFAIRHELIVLAASADDESLFAECRERFLREAQALVLLGRVAGASDGIVRVQTYFEALGTCFLVMDYVEGASLASVLRQQPDGLAAGRVRSLLSQLLSAIDVVHRAGLMHRDIKPANIIMRDDDRVVLIDFGSSREATSGQTTAYTQIYSGGYAPPEQMLGLRQGAFSDIYAIGAVCYQAIGGTVLDAMARQIAVSAGRSDPQPSAAEVGAGRYPDQLLAAIDAALITDAARRPQTVEAMLETLAREAPAPDAPPADATIVLARRPAPAAAPQPQPPSQPQQQPRRRGLWGVAAGAGALVLVGAVYVVLRGPATPPAGNRGEFAAGTPAQPTNVPPATADDATKHVTAAGGQPEAAPTVAPTPVLPMQSPQHEAIAVPQPPPMSAPAPIPPDTAPAIPPAAVPPAAPPQREAAAAPQPAPVSAPARTQPDTAPAIPPAAAPSAVTPQREAIVVPPATLTPVIAPPLTAPPAAAPAPAPSPRGVLSPLERAQAAAGSLPCSILQVANGQDGLRVSGLAPAGQDLDRLLVELRDLGRLAENITRVDRFACGPLAAIGTLVRKTRDASPTTFAIRIDQRDLPSGARLGIDAATVLPSLYVDLYQSDGSVRHVLRPASSGKPARLHADWIAASPPGPRLVVAIGSAAPLDLGARPDTEKAADYLTVLATGLGRATGATSADVAMVTVHAAEPAVAPMVAKVPQARPPNVRSDRCANIISRVQLGETLTDAERAALRTECRS